MPKPNIIAIDGPAASGKTTVGDLLAVTLGYLFFDTGLMYRAVTWKALFEQISVSDEAAVNRLAESASIDVRPPSVPDGRRSDVFVDGRDVTRDIQSPAVDANVSQVSAYAGVRQALTEKQRAIGLRGRVVMVGRDIGTVVLPEADLKVFLDASIDERARRRFNERQERGESASYECILSSMQRRDQIDSTRIVAPLKIAPDAVHIPTDRLTIQEVFQRVFSLVQE